MSVLDAQGNETPTTDVNRLRFPPYMVAGVVTTALGIVGGMWAIGSDVRDIKTRMEMQDKYFIERQQMETERQRSIMEAIQELRRKQDLQAYEMTRFNEKLSEKGR